MNESNKDYKGGLSEKECLKLINNDLELLDRLYDLDLTPEQCPPDSRNRGIMYMIVNMWNDCLTLDNQASAEGGLVRLKDVIEIINIKSKPHGNHELWDIFTFNKESLIGEMNKLDSASTVNLESLQRYEDERDDYALKCDDGEFVLFESVKKLLDSDRRGL